MRPAAFAAALALIAAVILPVLTSSSPAQAGCTRVYTTSGWVTRC